MSTISTDVPEIIPTKLDLESIKVNDEGLTLQDLLVTFIKECNKHKYLVTGIIVGNEHNHPHMFGNVDTKFMKAMMALGHNILTKENIVSEQVISGGSN